MAKNTELKVRITGDSASYTNQVFKATAANDAFGNSVHGVSKGLVAINGPLGGIATRFEAVRSIMTTNTVGWVGLGSAITGASAVLLSSIKTYNQHEQQQLKVQQLLKTTGYAAGLSAQELQTQAEEVALSTLASVTGIQEAQGALLTFKSVQGDTFTEAIELSQDMAAVFGGTAKDKALQLGKALQDPIKGINALSRSGVSFSDSQKAMIKSMVEAGDKASAQRIILDELAGQIVGSGAAQAGGLAGSIDTLGQRWEKLQINLAKGTAAETATDWINGLANAFYRLGEAIEPSVKGLETQLTILENRLNSGFFGRNKDSQKSAVLKEIEAVNQALLITKARSGDIDSLDTLINTSQTKIAGLETTDSGSKGGASPRMKAAANAGRSEELAAEKAFLKEMQKLRDDAQKIKDQSEATQEAIKAQEQAEKDAKKKTEADKLKTKAQSDLQSLRKTLADKKELEQMAYLERQQAIYDIQAAGVLTEEESRSLYLESYQQYQQRNRF